MEFHEIELKIEKLKVGKITKGFVIGFLVSVIILGVGAYFLLKQITEGLIVTGARTIGLGGVTWGVYVIFIIFFIGVSFSGIALAVLIRIFRMKELEVLSRIAELITIVSLILGAFADLLDQGNMFALLLNLPQYARAMSPFFGTFTLVVSGYLFASLVFLFLSFRKDAYILSKIKSPLSFIYKILSLGWSEGEEGRYWRVSFWLSIFILPLLVTAHSTLGFIFGIQSGRAGWFSALQAPGFVVMAGVSGLGVIILASYVLRIYGIEVGVSAKRTLANMLMVLIIIYIYFSIVEELTASYASPEKDREVAHEIMFGKYAPIFWTTQICLFIPFAILFYQFVSGKVFDFINIISGILVNVSAILKRYLIVVPSQEVGTLLPYPRGSYTPTLVEISLVISLFALGFFMLLIISKIFPIIPLSEWKPTTEEKFGFKRLSIFFTTMGLGILLAIIGFLDSARFFREYYSDPVIPLAPVVFILGVMLFFTSFVLLQVLPKRKN